MIRDTGSGRTNDSGAYLKNGSGPADNQGAVYVVAGCSGQISGGSLNHPVMFMSLNQLGSVVIDVDGPRLDAKFLRETGAIDDYFTIIKGAAAEPLRFATIRFSAGTVEAVFKTIPGRAYRIEKTPNLENPQWTALSGEITASSVTTHWTGALPEASRYFFRVVQTR